MLDAARHSEHASAAAFGSLLRQYRRAAGLTQEALADRSGLSVRAIRGLERGEGHSPRPDTVDLLARALGLSGERRAPFEESARWSSAAPVVSESLNPSLGGDLAEPATPLVGRERLVSEAAGFLRRSGVRILTLNGTGGVGKTRVALRVAEELRPEYADGAVLVGLEAITDPTQVLPVIGRAMGLRDTGSRPLFGSLQGYLSEKELLLILDNFEQVQAAAPSLARLLSRCPQLKMLVTSRTPLRIRAEQQLDVPPLETPAPMPVTDLATIKNSPAVALFAERARAVDPSFRLTDANAPAVAEICRRLDGLPLAIELAASRSKLLAPETLLSRLTPSLGLLAGGGPDLPERQRTMRHTIEWSHDLLNEDEQALFRRLAVFLGGCALEAAEAVCSSVPALSNQPGERLDILDGLSSLVDASLLQREDGPEAEPRLKMLAVVREYARQRLAESGEATVVRERHAEYFVAQAETAEPGLLGPDQVTWLERLEREHDNLREALRWAREAGDVEAGLRLAGALCWFWWTRGYHCEGRQWVEEFLMDDGASDHPVDSPVRAKAMQGAGELAFGQGDLMRAVELLEKSLVLHRESGDEDGVASVLVELGQVARARGDHVRAASLSEEGLALSRKLGDRMGAAIALNTLGGVERQRGNVEGARARHEESLALFGELGNERSVAYTLTNLGLAALERGDYERALALHQESLALYKRLGDKTGTALVLVNLGDVAHEQGYYVKSTTQYADALALYRELGNEKGVARALERLAAER